MQFDPPLTPSEIEGALDDAYKIAGLVQQGGQGAVYRAHCESTPTEALALKIYFADQVEERLLREVEALKCIDCDTLVKLVGWGRCTLRGQDCIWLATRFIDGGSIRSLLTAGKSVEVETVLIVLRDVAAALDHLWRRRIVHRDIKPENVMLSSARGAVLIDLGVARHTLLNTLTAAGATCGTLGYLSPEQMRAQRALTCKSDIFALGIVLQECILGRHPTARRQELLARGGPPTSPLRSGLPRELSAVIDRMVRSEAYARPLPHQLVEWASKHLKGAL